MPNINISVKNKIAIPDDTIYVCGNSDFTVVFSFDGEWKDYNTKTARFSYGGSYQDVVFTGNECPMPIISNTNTIQIGVFAGDLHTTTPAVIMARKSILCGFGSPAAPSDDVYNQIMDVCNETKDIAQSVRDDAAAGKFDGEPGEPGKDGYTPVKGTDYWTEEDKAEIVAAVCSELPPTEGAVLYTEQTLTNEQKVQARENIDTMSTADIKANNGMELSEIWAAISALQTKTLEYPKLKQKQDWFPSSLTSTVKANATAIRFVDSYTPTGEETKTWTCDVNGTGDIKGYYVGTEVIIAGNGSGKIRMNETSSVFVQQFMKVTEISGFDVLDASEVTKINDGFSNLRSLEDIDLSALKTPKLVNLNYAFSDNPKLKSVILPQYGLQATTSHTFYNCPLLEKVDFGRGTTTIGTNAFRKCINLERVDGLRDVTSIGDYAFCYTPKLTADFRPEKITSIGRSAFYRSGVEDKCDFSVVDIKGVGVAATRHTRWSSDELKAIQSISVPDVYLEVKNSTNQKLYADYIFAKATENGKEILASFADYGCSSFAMYHIWQALHPENPHADFMSWFNAEVDYDPNNKIADMVFGDNLIATIINRLGWTPEYEPYKKKVVSAEQKQIIADRLREGKPTYVVVMSTNTVGGHHAVAIIGSDSKTGKFAVIDSGAYGKIDICEPHMFTGTDGVVSWHSFEDIFENVESTGVEIPKLDNGKDEKFLDAIAPMDYGM